MSDIPRLPLNDGAAIAQVGFGVFQVPAEETARIVGTALDAGYPRVDTAWGYMNEAGVGEAVAVRRDAGEEVAVTTKVWNSYQGRDKTLESFETSMAALGLDVLDLLLIHWPAPANDLYVETWETFVELRDQGRVRSIGVSNFQPEHIHRVIEATGVVPALNQVELHPYFPQRTLRDFHDLHGIVTEAWSPIARGRVADDPVIQGIAEAHGRTPAQVTLRWEVQHGIAVVPKSVTPERIASNLALFDFELSDEEMAVMDGLDRGDAGRMGPDPDTFS
ncbi:MAG: aldo/keto reductase [Acidimicrobiales bacterium]|nr:aldo/keto reductase [Acidimicrobiales bacterium]